MELRLIFAGLVVMGVCVFVTVMRLKERRTKTVWKNKTPGEGGADKDPLWTGTLLPRLRQWYTAERMLTVVLLAACIMLGMRDGDATLPVLMTMLLGPGLVLHW